MAFTQRDQNGDSTYMSSQDHRSLAGTSDADDVVYVNISAPFIHSLFARQVSHTTVPSSPFTILDT